MWCRDVTCCCCKTTQSSWQADMLQAGTSTGILSKQVLATRCSDRCQADQCRPLDYGNAVLSVCRHDTCEGCPNHMHAQLRPRRAALRDTLLLSSPDPPSCACAENCRRWRHRMCNLAWKTGEVRIRPAGRGRRPLRLAVQVVNMPTAL